MKWTVEKVERCHLSLPKYLLQSRCHRTIMSIRRSRINEPNGKKYVFQNQSQNNVRQRRWILFIENEFQCLSLFAPITGVITSSNDSPVNVLNSVLLIVCRRCKLVPNLNVHSWVGLHYILHYSTSNTFALIVSRWQQRHNGHEAHGDYLHTTLHRNLIYAIVKYISSAHKHKVLSSLERTKLGRRTTEALTRQAFIKNLKNKMEKMSANDVVAQI